MHHADIKAALVKKNQPPSAVAKKLRVQRSVVSQVIHDKARSQRVAKTISQIINKPVRDIWPGSYPKLELEELRGRSAA